MQAMLHAQLLRLGSLPTMPDSLLIHLRTALMTPAPLSPAELRRLQRECTVVFPPQRCPHCHARLFDGWLFGQVKCWRCAALFTGYLDRFLAALKATT